MTRLQFDRADDERQSPFGYLRSGTLELVVEQLDNVADLQRGAGRLGGAAQVEEAAGVIGAQHGGTG
jgi:hypothetical protein